ncbi:DUF2852 domain-containing protein [Falsiroseomonas sp. HW251]|uniref:DUF2852 domain-containing protein n=1 Tax=Falsiroseomonas sp. HW251 TaxID=3390998 RepID=UPI003D316E11
MSAASSAMPLDEMPAGLPPDLAWRWHKQRRKAARREARAARWAPWGGHPLRGWRLPVMILGFIAWWPIGLALLALFFFWRPAMACSSANWTAPWKARMREAMEQRPWSAPASTGNVAFDEYRANVLARLEEERRQLDAQAAEFGDFVKQLRRAKDQEEFERFMQSRERPRA